MRKSRIFRTRREGRARVEAGWLLVVAALVGALATYGVWASVSRRRLSLRAVELEKTLETRTTELESARLQLQRLSTEDPLTAVANHEQFLEFLDANGAGPAATACRCRSSSSTSITSAPTTGSSAASRATMC